MLVPRKRCPKCSATFEGPEVPDLHSCDVCGNGYLCPMPDLDTDAEQRTETRLPRAGGGGNLRTHTRDDF